MNDYEDDDRDIFGSNGGSGRQTQTGSLHPSLAPRRRSTVAKGLFSSGSARNTTSSASGGEAGGGSGKDLKKRQSVYYIDKTESRDPALKQLWSGDLNKAEVAFAANKKQDPLAYVRWAEVHFMRFWLCGDREMADGVVKRFAEAEEACLKASEAFTLQLSGAIEKHNAKQTLIRRTSRRLSRAAPWTASVGLTTKDNPGELLPSALEFQSERQALDDWKRLQGLAALCAMLSGATQMLSHSNVRGAMSLRRAWQISRRASDNAEFHADVPNALGLVIGTFQIALCTVPPWVLGFLRAAGFSADAVRGKETLEHIIKETDPAGETHNYARLVLAGNGIMTSAQEYRPDRGTHLKKADEILSEVLAKYPDWVLFQWMHSHVLRRLGKPQEAVKLISNLAVQIQNQMSKVSLRLSFDLACLHFVQRDWTNCEKLLKPLLLEENHFTSRGFAYAMMGASCAMRGNIIESVDWLEKLEKVLADEKAAGRADSSWLLKVGTLYHRPHKRTLFYEISYLFGFIKWFDFDVAGTLRVGGKELSKEWLGKTTADLGMMHDEASVSVVYPEWPVLKEEAAEELLSVSLMSGCVASMRGELDKADRFFKTVLDNNGTRAAKEGTREDPWHTAFALYELGSMEIRRSQFLAARQYLVKCMARCKRKDFSFHHMLSFKVSGALRYIAEQSKPTNVSQAEWKLHTDELGQWIGDMGTADGQAAAGPGEMTAAQVTRGEKFELKRPMKLGDTISWSWAVETHDVGFQAYFVGSKSGKQDDEEVEPYTRYEAGDFVEGFYSSRQAGTLKLSWDNSYSKFTDKKIHYALNQ
ncbi:hypothetical protein BASA81_002329 [Batrachochytrium salamandrivorans]|nr:hypothetical protein BASA81_002329 [Batrachochytrium salamandrivorans]